MITKERRGAESHIFSQRGIVKKCVCILVCGFFFAQCGCTFPRCSQGIRRLKELARSEKEKEEYVRIQEELFYALRDDLISNRLKKGPSKEEIIDKYGETIFSQKVKNQPGVAYVMLYRHPVQFFNSDRIYLYFDYAYYLVSWEYKPHYGILDSE